MREDLLTHYRSLNCLQLYYYHKVLQTRKNRGRIPEYRCPEKAMNMKFENEANKTRINWDKF